MFVWLCSLVLVAALSTPAIAGQRIPTVKEAVSESDAATAIELVAIPAGCFHMGSTDGNTDEKPVHEVCLSSFSIGKYEVTQGQWKKIMGENPSYFSACGNDCPVEQVSWEDIQTFFDRLYALTGRNYRLPTEAEWEYACTGGGKDKHYCGGNDVDRLAWYEANGGGRTHPVGQLSPNRFGIYDMSGNVWEWVQDWKEAYSPSRQQNPWGARWGSARARRGGSWQYGSRQARAAWRSSGYPGDHALDLGFRVVLPPPARANSPQRP